MFYASIGLFVLGVLFFLLGCFKMALARYAVKNLGGKWTWDLIVNPNGSLFVFVHLWPGDRVAKEMLHTASRLSPNADSQGLVLRYVRMERFVFSEHYFEMAFADVLNLASARAARVQQSQQGRPPPQMKIADPAKDTPGQTGG